MKTQKPKLRIANDLDGTLYDLMPINLDITNNLIKPLGYAPISREQYLSVYQTYDWRKFYHDLGIRDKHVDSVIDGFIRLRKSNIPKLIPGAKKFLANQEQVAGAGNIYFITQAPRGEVEFRFRRDGIEKYLPNTFNPFEGKAHEIHRLAMQDPNIPLIYVGDIISDGEACHEAREMGADNVRFCGICHQYGFNSRDSLKEFTKNHSDFASTFDGLEEVGKIWKD